MPSLRGLTNQVTLIVAMKRVRHFASIARHRNGLSSLTSAEETAHLSCVKLRKARYAWNAQVIAWVTNCRGGELHGRHTSTRKTKEAKIKSSMKVTCPCLGSQLSLTSAIIVRAKMIKITT